MPRTPRSKPLLDVRQPGLVDTIIDRDAMALWECLRRLDRATSAAELAEASARPLDEVDGCLRRLERCGLVRRVRARGRRRTVGYRVTIHSIIIEFDRCDAEQRGTVERIIEHIDRRLEQDLFRDVLPLDRMGPNDWHFRHCGPLALEPDDLAELQRRIGRVEEFVALLANRHASDARRACERCNHGIAIRVAPLRGRVLAQPSVEFLSRSPLSSRRRAEREGLAPLSPRERSVALALRSGATRAEVARRLGLSVLTVGTLCKRIYRKLGVRRATELHRVLLD